VRIPVINPRLYLLALSLLALAILGTVHGRTAASSRSTYARSRLVSVSESGSAMHAASVRWAAPMLLVERAAIAADPDKLAAFDLVHPEIARMAREAEA
jgi:hypothetical protein